MSFETARKAMELCKDKNFRLVFAGGEPLLNFELIKEIYKYLQEEHYDCKLSMQTNGSLISHKIAENYRKWKSILESVLMPVLKCMKGYEVP